MARPKPSTISRDPYAGDAYAFLGTPIKKEPEKKAEEPVVSREAEEPARKSETEKFTTPYPVDLLERARNAAYWDRATLSGIIIQAVSDALDRMEEERGEAYPPRNSELRGGRPIGSKKARKA